MNEEANASSPPASIGWGRRLRNMADDYLPQGRWLSIAAAAFVVYVVAVIGLGMYWSMTPGQFDVNAKASSYAGQAPVAPSDATGNGQAAAPGSASGPVTRPVTGSVTTAALLGVVDTLLSKPGGYLRNDWFPPGVYSDNIPNWEYGVLIQSRDLVRAMREFFSRSQSQSKEDADLSLAEPLLNFQSDSWMLPSTENEYRKAMRSTESYLKRLMDPDAQNAQFYARADNLREWLSMVNTRLGSLSQRLSASVSKRRVNTDLAGEGNASQSTAAPGEIEVRTPWGEIDDVFYESRGAAWALIHFLKAVEVDFADILENKNAQVSLRQIVRELEGTQGVVWSPLILNGSGFGPLANHSLVMASYISRANAAIIDLRDLLSQG